MYDAVYLFARGLHGVQNAKNMNFRQSIMCNSSTSWEDGISLLNYMKTVSVEGIYQITRILNYCTYLKLIYLIFLYLQWRIDGWQSHNSCND